MNLSTILLQPRQAESKLPSSEGSIQHSETNSVGVTVVGRRIAAIGKAATRQEQLTCMWPFLCFPLQQGRITTGAVVNFLLFIILRIDE
jgi:hypothetical protein